MVFPCDIDHRPCLLETFFSRITWYIVPFLLLELVKNNIQSLPVLQVICFSFRTERAKRVFNNLHLTYLTFKLTVILMFNQIALWLTLNMTVNKIEHVSVSLVHCFSYRKMLVARIWTLNLIMKLPRVS